MSSSPRRVNCPGFLWGDPPQLGSTENWSIPSLQPTCASPSSPCRPSFFFLSCAAGLLLFCRLTCQELPHGFLSALWARLPTTQASSWPGPGQPHTAAGAPWSQATKRLPQGGSPSQKGSVWVKALPYFRVPAVSRQAPLWGLTVGCV